ncbi:MAG: serine/threonine-protein kinase [Planctomycetota bacterium]
MFSGNGDASGQESDVVLAAELIRSGLLSDRQLTNALGGWSVHGSVPLNEHLRGLGVLTDQQLLHLRQAASARTGSATTPIAGNADGSPSASLGDLLSRHDPSGRVARLLGVSAASGVSENDARRSPARYELLRKLGQGGLGRVWLARDTSLGRLVALKEVTNAGEASEVTLARFRNEAEITGRLEHPGIVPIYQLGDDADTGNAFYTMRFLGKATLQDAISEYHERREAGDHDPMLLRHLLTAFVNICHAIGHAHSRHVIHRDLKPENVVIDSFGQVIVIDWGLAKLLDDAAVEQLGAGAISGEHSSTMEGQVLGTPLYMAPEQAAGRLDEVDERTDIYGLGGILFAIVTGQAPHEQTQAGAAKTGGGGRASAGRAGAGRAMISAIVSGPTPDAFAVNPQADPPLAAICTKAMARRRYARYQSASELADEVQRWMADEPVAAYEEPPLAQARRWVKRHERLSQVLAAVAAVLIAGAVTTAASARQAAIAQQQARYEQMRGDAREVELQLRTSAQDLASDARFMAGLPPIQGIIRARQQGAPGVVAEAGESEDVWRSRLENIYTGLLRSDPEYLAVAYIAALPQPDGEGFAAQELVRVERNTSDRTLLRSLPASRLRRFDTDPFLDGVLQLEPGDTAISIDPRPWQSPAAAVAHRLTIATPIYAEATGEPFGMVAIETDVALHLRTILRGLGQRAGDVFITDPLGVVHAAATSRDGATMRLNGRPIAEHAPAAAPLFEARTPGRELGDGATFYAKLVQVHPTGKGVGIVAAVPAGE